MTRVSPWPPTHPGELIREELAARDKTVVSLAVACGVPPYALDRVLNGLDPVTPKMAKVFGRVFGNGPTLWLNMQAARDAWFAEKEKTP